MVTSPYEWKFSSGIKKKQINYDEDIYDENLPPLYYT